MAIDPVVLLAEDLRLTEAALNQASAVYSKHQNRKDGELVSLLLTRMKRLYNDFFKTIPTSALGAAELVRMAAARLPFSHSRYATHLNEIADRLAMGRKVHADLVWLRALQAALGDGFCGKNGTEIAPWIRLAVTGASRPVIVFRSVQPTPGAAPWKTVLAQPEAAAKSLSLEQ